jgi:RNA polymerase sigma-70 factor (sigma-E family)
VDRLGRTSRKDGFDRYVNEVTRDLLRTGYLIVWSLPEAEDLVQETLLRVARRWPNVEKMDYPVAYARRILVNLATDTGKRHSRNRGELSAWQDMDGRADDAAAQALIAVDERSVLLAMLAELPRRQRAVLVLRYFEGLSESETADCLEWPLGTVKSTTARALDHLRRTHEVLPGHQPEVIRGGGQDG